MVVLALVVGAALGAIAGLGLGDMVKFSILGETLNHRYVFMLLGSIVGYGVAWMLTRSYSKNESSQEQESGL